MLELTGFYTEFDSEINLENDEFAEIIGYGANALIFATPNIWEETPNLVSWTAGSLPQVTAPPLQRMRVHPPAADSPLYQVPLYHVA